MEEITRVLSYKKLERFINPFEAQILPETLHQKADIAKDLPFVELSSDPDDNRIIAMALAGQANYLVSGDKVGFLSLGMAHDIPILTARQMAERLKLD